MVQALLPQRLLSNLARRVSHNRLPWFKNSFIRTFSRLFRVDLDEARSGNPADYPHFDAFFTRALKPGIRPLPAVPEVLVSPCDGTVSQRGEVTGGRIFQAKGKSFSPGELLADPGLAASFDNGRFITLYLSPRDYHRVHMPIDGRLVREVHVPGRLFSVSERSTRSVPRLFARNERLVMEFETGEGPLCVVMIAAMLVSGIETVWREGIYALPRHPSELSVPPDRTLRRGDELGRFHWGSTVILLRPAGSAPWRPELRPGTRVRMGQAITIPA